MVPGSPAAEAGLLCDTVLPPGEVHGHMGECGVCPSVGAAGRSAGGTGTQCFPLQEGLNWRTLVLKPYKVDKNFLHSSLTKDALSRVDTDLYYQSYFCSALSYCTLSHCRLQVHWVRTPVSPTQCGMQVLNMRKRKLDNDNQYQSQYHERKHCISASFCLTTGGAHCVSFCDQTLKCTKFHVHSPHSLAFLE